MKPTAGSLMVRGTSLEELEEAGRRSGVCDPAKLTVSSSSQSPGPRPRCSHRFSTTTTAAPSGRNSATVSKSLFSLAASPTLCEPSGMNLLEWEQALSGTPALRVASISLSLEKSPSLPSTPPCPPPHRPPEPFLRSALTLQASSHGVRYALPSCLLASASGIQELSVSNAI